MKSGFAHASADAQYIHPTLQKKAATVDFAAMAEKVLTFCMAPGLSDEGHYIACQLIVMHNLDELTKFIALTWIQEFITLAKVEHCCMYCIAYVEQRKVLPFLATIIAAILPSMSSDVAKIREPATAANNLLKKLVTPDDDLEVAPDGRSEVKPISF